MSDFAQSDITLKRDTWYLVANQNVFVTSAPAVPQSIVVIVNGLIQTYPGVFSVDGNGVVTMSEACLPGDTVVLRYTPAL